jgi:hypothetical protein
MGSDAKMSRNGDEDPVTALLTELFTPTPPPPLPERLTPTVLRSAIASALARISANELAEECVRFGLPPEAENEDGPWRGKHRYVERRIRHWKLPELLALGHDVATVYDDDRVLNHLLGLDGLRGVRGEMKNLIFAADGPKPRVVLHDAISNDLKVVENEQYCLIYDKPLSMTGLTWRQLTAWWAKSDGLDGEEERAAAHDLYARLLRSMERNGAERFVFERYSRPVRNSRIRHSRLDTAGLRSLRPIQPPGWRNPDPAANGLPAAARPTSPGRLGS